MQKQPDVSGKRSGNLYLILGIAGVVLLLCLVGVAILVFGILRNRISGSPGNVKPDHFGVYVKLPGGLVELPEREIFSIPVEKEVENVTAIGTDKPTILVWRANTQVDYLVLFRLGIYLNQQEEVQFQVAPAEDGIIEIIPVAPLKSGIYCLVQGDPMAAFLPGWCFQVGARQSQNVPTPTKMVQAVEPTPDLLSHQAEATATRLAVVAPTRDPDIKDDMVRIWKVGSPHNNNIPENIIPVDLRLAAEQQGLQVQIETFPSQGFGQIFFDAFMQNEAPDILAFDNYGIIEGRAAGLPNYQGIGTPVVLEKMMFVSDSFDVLLPANGGWVVIFTSSPNFEQVKKMVFWNIQCDQPSNGPLGSNQELLQAARTVLAGLYGMDINALNAATGGVFPQDALSITRRDGPAALKEAFLCDTWGNQNIAFVQVLSTFEGNTRLGHEHLVLVFRLNDQGWRIVQVIENADKDRFNIIKALKGTGIVFDGSDSGQPAKELTVLAPSDNAVMPRTEVPELKWEDLDGMWCTWWNHSLGGLGMESPNGPQAGW